MSAAIGAACIYDRVFASEAQEDTCMVDYKWEFELGAKPTQTTDASLFIQYELVLVTFLISFRNYLISKF